MKKKLFIILLLCIIVASALATFAFMTRKTDAESIITFGNLKLKLHLYENKDGEKAEVKPDDEISILKMNDLSRILSVENVGNHPMYVRVSFQTYTLEKKEKKEIDNVISINAKENWIYKDGYYYYNKVLNPQDVTGELMDKIEFNTDIINSEYNGKTISLKIEVEAVQSEHNSNNVLEALGWPS